MLTKTKIVKVLAYFWYYQILVSQTAFKSYSALLHLGICYITALYWYNNRNQFGHKFSTELHQSY